MNRPATEQEGDAMKKGKKGGKAGFKPKGDMWKGKSAKKMTGKRLS